MYALPGATQDSNRGVAKQRRGVYRRMPALTLLLPNFKAKHRQPGHRVAWKYQIAYIQNRWYAEYRPGYRRIMQRLKLRK
jgi:hypothetical protein